MYIKGHVKWFHLINIIKVYIAMNYLLADYFSPLIISYFGTHNSSLHTQKLPIIESELTLKLHRVYVSCFLYLYVNWTRLNWTSCLWSVLSVIEAYSTTSATCTCTCIITSQARLHLGMSWISSAPYFCLWENCSQWVKNGNWAL